MTAATSEVAHDQWYSISALECTLTSGTKAYKNASAQAVLGTDKNVVPATTGFGKRFLGIFEENVDATASAKKVVVRLVEPVFCKRFRNGSSTDAVVATDFLAPVYQLDDVTVSRDPVGKVPVGLCYGLIGGMVLVVPFVNAGVAPVIQGAALSFTANDCAVTAAQIINGGVYKVPATAAASTISLPAAGVAAGTVVRFVANGTANGHTVQYRSGTTAISAALTASKIHGATLIFDGAVWGASVTAAP